MTGFKGTAEQVLGKELCPGDLQRLGSICWSVLFKGTETPQPRGLVIEHDPMHRKVVSSILGQGTSLGCGLDPQ